MTANPNDKADHPARLRSMLHRGECLMAPGAFSPFVVPLIEEAGFPLVYATGLGAAASVAGYPDVGLLTQTEMVNHVRYVAQRASVPVIADADTGYGGATNAARTVQEYEAAGVSGLHMEDQDWPKRCGHLADKAVIPTEEMVEKIDAMVNARRNGDFVIFARSDAIAVEGFEAAVERGHRYLEAGADGLFFDALQTRDQIATVGRTFDVPLILNMSLSGLTPSLTPAEAGALGYRIMLFAGAPIMAAHASLRRYFGTLRETGSQESLRSQITPLKEFLSTLHVDRYL